MEENLKQQPSDVIKIAIFGSKNTGKTTLCTQLAAHFDTIYASDFASKYLQHKWTEKQESCEPEDLIPIALGQFNAENEALLTANKFLFCDTTLLSTKVFSEINFNFCNPIIDNAACKHTYNLVLLTDEISASDKKISGNKIEVSEIYRNALVSNKKPFVLLTGSEQERLGKAIKIVHQLLEAVKMGFTSEDFVQFYEQNRSLETISNHLQYYKEGVSKININRPATINDGIIKFSEDDFNTFSNIFETNKKSYKLEKFVPASGAASRMFKFLLDFLTEYNLESESIDAYIIRKKADELKIFLAGIEKFPFYKEVLQQQVTDFPDFNVWSRDKKNYHFIKQLIGINNLDFANKPKGILPFHAYNDKVLTPIEEHLKESVDYAVSNEVSFLHFTVSEAHQPLFEAVINKSKKHLEDANNTTITVNFSFQNKASDVMAVDANNIPIRESDGSLLFRPGGHGALIENLNNVDADIVFIKNIDNVVYEKFKKSNIYKKALAGLLIDLQQQTFSYLNLIQQKKVTANDIQNIADFATNKLFLQLKENFYKNTFQLQLDYLFQMLNRPIRICGMVKNEGEPGGGPFWVKDDKAQLSLQIVESSQIDLSNAQQNATLQASTHFNPVDLVCGLKSHVGSQFDLLQYVDPKSGFIVEKNKNGVHLKSYELPGLWNGAMSKWITIFVEVPLSTFNPVKTVNDLLKPSHQQY